MISSITRRAIKPNRIPYNAIFIVFFSFLISLLAFRNPILYELFYEKVQPELHWSWFTSNFLHGTGDLNSMISHLIGNIVIGTLIFAYLIENILGTGKAFMYTFFSIIFTLLYSYITTHYGHGASNITYSYFAFGIFICLEYIKRLRWKALKDPFFILLFFLTIYCVIGNITFYIGNTNIGGRNVHTISFVIGIALSLLWRKDIESYFDDNFKEKYKFTSRDILSIVLICLMSIYLVYSIFAVNQELEKRTILKEITQDMGIPQTKEELNNNGGQVVIRFEEEMLPIIHSYNTNISINNLYIPAFKWKWLDTKTLYIKIYSPLGEDVNIYQVVFNNLTTRDYESLGRKVELSLVE
ncbi:MAG: rhomboid family intramembrane serine protease [bacterium]